MLAKSRGSCLTLVVNKAPGGGTLGVYVKGKKVATVPTTARRAALKVVVTLKVRTAGVPVVLRLDAPGSRGSVDRRDRAATVRSWIRSTPCATGWR